MVPVERATHAGAHDKKRNEQVTKSEMNKQIVDRFISGLFTDGDVSAVDRYLDPGFINHDPPLPGAPHGPEGMRQAGEVFRRAFPDWRSEDEQLVAEGDLVVESFVASGQPQRLCHG
jgi:predicted SnoaL-like aldol condensation-catalyzing enzyme